MVDGPPRGNQRQGLIMRKFIGWAIVIGLLLYAISHNDEAYGHTQPVTPDQGQHHATD